MTRTFEKSARSLAARQLISALVALLVAAAFAFIFVLAEAPSIFVQICAVTAIGLALLVVAKIIRELMQTLKSGQPWKVEITDTDLVWNSPVPEIMAPFTIPLAEIHRIRRVFVRKKNSKVSPKNHYYIDLKDGTSVEIFDQLSAIPPKKVFLALADVGIEFIESTVAEGATVSFASSG